MIRSAQRAASRFILPGMVVLLSAGRSWGLNPPLPDWLQRVHLGGNAAMRYQQGQPNAELQRDGGFSINQASLVIDVDVAPNLSFWYDTNIIREGVSRNTVAPIQQMYVRWDRILEQEWLNTKIGRTFTPYGEEYLLWDAIDNPLASPSTIMPWAQDEGILFFGDLLPAGRLSYATSVQNGNFKLNNDDNSSKTIAARLSSWLMPWFYVSGSYLNLGKQGNATEKGLSEWWLSGEQIAPLGPTTAASGQSPSNIVDGQAVEGDAKFTSRDLGEIWLRAGYFYHHDGGGSQYNRTVRYYSGQALGVIPHTGRKAYLVTRYSVIGTFSPTLGYHFEGTEFALPGFENHSNPYEALQYNQRDLYRTSLGAGYRIHPNALLKVEYSWEGTHVIESAKTPENLAMLGDRNFFITELAVRF